MRFALRGDLLRERPYSLTLGSESRRPTLRDEATLRNASLLVFGAAGCSLMNQAHSLFNLEGVDPHGNNVSVWTRWDYGGSAAS